MSISSTRLEEFRDIYRSQFGEELTQDELEQKARYLLVLYKAVYGDPKTRIAELKDELRKGM